MGGIAKDHQTCYIRIDYVSQNLTDDKMNGEVVHMNQSKSPNSYKEIMNITGFKKFQFWYVHSTPLHTVENK